MGVRGYKSHGHVILMDKPPGGGLPVPSVHSFTINCQLLFLDQRKRKTGSTNMFMARYSKKNVPDAGVALDALSPQAFLLPTELPWPLCATLTYHIFLIAHLRKCFLNLLNRFFVNLIHCEYKHKTLIFQSDSC